MSEERLIRSPDGRAIGVLRSSPLGWRAAAFPGIPSEDIDAVMDACEPIFARIIEARRGSRVARHGKSLRLVSGAAR